MATQTQTCYSCGAVIDSGYMNRHRSFHSDLERKLRDIAEEATRAKRLARK